VTTGELLLRIPAVLDCHSVTDLCANVPCYGLVALNALMCATCVCKAVIQAH